MKNTEMRNNVVALGAIQAKNSALNKDMDGNIRTNGKGEMIATPNSINYFIRNHMNMDKDNRVFYKKSYKANEKEEFQPLNINEKYEELYKTTLKKDNMIKALANLMTSVDNMNNGVACAGEKSISIMGATQMGYGVNKNILCNIDTHGISSQFRNKDDSLQTTLGTTTVTDDAHYFYNCNINPSVYDSYKDILKDEGFIGYTVHAYNALKEGMLEGATLYNSSSKQGCKNEFGMFIKFIEGYTPITPDFVDVLKFYYDEEDRATIDITTIKDILSSKRFMENILDIEIYYNPYTTVLKGGDIEKATVYNIITREEVK